MRRQIRVWAVGGLGNIWKVLLVCSYASAAARKFLYLSTLYDTD